MFFEEVAADLIQLLAVKVEEFAALLTLQVEAGLAWRMAVFSNVFETCRAVGIYQVFVQDAFIHKAFQLTVYRGLADGRVF